MSLSSMLDDQSSALRRFMEKELGEVAAVREHYRALVPAGLEVARPAPPVGSRAAWGTLGAAVDHRLRYALAEPADVGDDGAIGGGVFLSGSPGFIDRPPDVAAALASAGAAVLGEIRMLLDEHHPSERARPVLLERQAEERLARACYAAVWYEELFRSGRLWPGTPLGDADAGVTMEHLLAAVPDYAVADLAAVAALAQKGLAELRGSTIPADVKLGPTFAGSEDVGGADGDWIAGGLLADVKATITPRRLATADFHQLAGYVLLDYDDHYRIGRVGWYLARAGKLVTWDAATFFRLLGARHSIADLRQRLRRVLTATTSRTG